MMLSRTMLSRSKYALTCGVMTLGLAVSGCRDRAKESEARAASSLTALLELATRDVEEVGRGLPEGATRFSSYVAKNEIKDDTAGARTGLVRVRREIEDLRIAKSTFFAVVDDKGLIVRSDLEQDTLVGQTLPGLDATRERSAWIGVVPELSKKPDRAFVAAARIPGRAPPGYLVTGWGFRPFALHLTDSLKRMINEETKGGSGKVPVYYVLVFDRAAVIGLTSTPDVVVKTAVDLGLSAKTASGTAKGALEITERVFGWAAARVPGMADGGIVVFRSET